MNAPLHKEMPPGSLDAAQALAQVSAQWDNDIVRQISDYIAIPAKSRRKKCRASSSRSFA